MLEWRHAVMAALQGVGPPPDLDATADDHTLEGGILSRWVLGQEWVDAAGAEWLLSSNGQGDGTNPPGWWTEGVLRWVGRALLSRSEDDE